MLCSHAVSRVQVFADPPRVLSDPQGRFAAMVLYNHHLAILPAIEVSICMPAFVGCAQWGGLCSSTGWYVFWLRLAVLADPDQTIAGCDHGLCLGQRTQSTLVCMLPYLSVFCCWLLLSCPSVAAALSSAVPTVRLSNELQK